MKLIEDRRRSPKTRHAKVKISHKLPSLVSKCRMALIHADRSLQDYATITKDYNISAQFCKPSGAKGDLQNPTVQVLTHGIGFDKTYWDLAYNDFNYSCM